MTALARLTRQALEHEILAKAKLRPRIRRRCFTVCLITGSTGGITSPRGPVGPLGPLGPVPPVTPEDPDGPLGPLAPLGPVGPVAPVGPEVPISGATAWPDISKALVTGSVLALICRSALRTPKPEGAKVRPIAQDCMKRSDLPAQPSDLISNSPGLVPASVAPPPIRRISEPKLVTVTCRSDEVASMG
jgi:hypothetical protein